MSGTVNISRDIWDHEAFAREDFTEREAWMWIICEASWKPRKKRVGNAIFELQRGQLATSIRFMGDAWGWSKSRVDRFLKRLSDLEMICAESGTAATIITVCNYDDFQGARDTSGTAAGQQRDTSGTNEKKGVIREEGKEDTASNEAVVVRAVDEVSEAVTAYNDAAARAGWPLVQKLTDQRRKALRGRLSDCGGIDGWRCALGKAEASDFLCGRTEKPWAGFGFDWITKPANFTKLMEGNYDNRSGQSLSANSSSAFLRSVARVAGAF